MIVEHSAAVLALLASAPDGPPLNVHVDQVPADVDVETSPYVRPFFDGSYTGIAFTGESREFVLGITVRSVAGSDMAVAMVADRVAKALLDKTPTVPGRVCYRIRFDSGTPPRPDESTGRLVVEQSDVYVLRSVPA